MSGDATARFVERIRRTGPMTVAEFMVEALHHRRAGYYSARDPLGRAGDFVTAPEISQMFGELLGLWMLSAWTGLGKPADAVLVELGPGRGTLMADAARAIAASGAGGLCRTPHLVETSGTLRRVQACTLRRLEPVWHRDLSTVPDRPWLVLANEFLDALPIHQLVFRSGEWREVLVTAARDGGGLCWGTDSRASPLAASLPAALRDGGEDGLMAEICPAADTIVATVAGQVAARGGAALFADYGGLRAARGASLQAVRGHRRVDPLREPGMADLSSHVDFARMRDVVAGSGSVLHGPVSQGDFLTAVGIHHRAETLARGGGPGMRHRVERDVRRLIDPDQMGTVFRIAAVLPAGSAVPPGFGS